MKRGSVDCLLNKSHTSCFTYPLQEKKVGRKLIESSNQEKNGKYRPVVVNVKPLNRTFLHVQETDDLFDFDFYQKHKKYKKVGYMKPNKKTGATTLVLKKPLNVKKTKTSLSVTKSANPTTQNQLFYGIHFDSIVYKKRALELMNRFMYDVESRRSDKKYELLFSQVHPSDIWLEKPFDTDKEETDDHRRIYKLIKVSGDGHCFYHAAKESLKHTHDINIPSPKTVRKILADLPNIHDDVKFRLLNDKYAESEEIKLFSKKYSVRILVWVVNTWDIYDETNQDKPKTIMLYLHGDKPYKLK
jgi:hypothetical protein